LKKLIWEVIDILKAHARWKHIDIIFDDNSLRTELEIDKDKIKQALYNLLYNAIKYSESNGIINVIVQEYDDFIKIIIQDYGIGVPDNEECKLFIKGSRTSNAIEKDPTGRGLGLYYSRLIIRSHQGDIILSNNRKPTEFTITLPYKHE